MTYPSMDQFNEAVQNPRTAFLDPVLQDGKVATNGLGIPIALGGGFALTYSITSGGRKFALRCFHKQAKDLEHRYSRISQALAALSSPRFVGFEYQQTGIRVLGSAYPVVKMDWADGETLGVWLEKSYRDKTAISSLALAFRRLEALLREKGIAHGDIQNGNVLVANDDIRLIDYDGVFVPGLPVGQGSEVGHKHFQHPGRNASNFGPAMDRFSFIVVELSLRALLEKPDLFPRHGNGENILFSASDYLDPAASPVFADVAAVPSLAKEADWFARVCRADASAVPSLEDFLAGRGIPAAPILVPSIIARSATGAAAPAYVGAYDVIDAADYLAALGRVGDRVELVGRIVEVTKPRYAKNRTQYIFVNFGPWRGKAVKLNFWSEGLANLASNPDDSWRGKWISVIGLLEAPYENKALGYTHIGITVANASQFRIIDDGEARRRLASIGKAGAPSSVGNRAVLEAITGSSAKPHAQGVQPSRQSAASSSLSGSNQAIIANIQAMRGVRTPQAPGAPVRNAGARVAPGSYASLHPARAPSPPPGANPSRVSPPAKSRLPALLAMVGVVMLLALCSRR